MDTLPPHQSIAALAWAAIPICPMGTDAALRLAREFMSTGPYRPEPEPVRADRGDSTGLPKR